MLPIFGYTDYPSGTLVRKVQVLSYDNNKYAEVRFEDGTEDSIKTGYIRRTPDLKQPLRKVDWHLLGGGTRRTYKRRSRRTEFTVHVRDMPCVPGSVAPTFDSQAKAVAFAIARAALTGETQQVYVAEYCHNGSHLGCRDIECFPTGEAVVFDYKRRSRRGQAKYLRGYGKFMGRQESRR